MSPNKGNNDIADVIKRLPSKDQNDSRNPGSGKVVANDGTIVTLNEK